MFLLTTPTMGERITTILGAFTTVLNALVTGLTDVVEFLVSNPLTVIAVGLTFVGIVFGIVRRYIKQ